MYHIINMIHQHIDLAQDYLSMILVGLCIVLSLLLSSIISSPLRKSIALRLGISNRFLIYTHHQSPIINHSNPSLTLIKILSDHCPSLVGSDAIFSPTPWLFNGHLQTIYSALGDFSKIDQVEYERKLIRLPDGGQIAVDLTPPGRFSNKLDATPTLIVLHGLTGGSHESYVRSILNPLTCPKRNNGAGWRAVVANFRGCAGSELTSQKLYHAGATDDLRSVLKYLSTILCPLTPLHGIGFSLGGNVLAKYLGEQAERSLIRSAIVVGNPWDLHSGHCFLESSWTGRFYSRALASNLRAMVKTHLKMFKTRSSHPPIDLHALFANPGQSIYEFDSIVTRALGRFSSTEAYYKTQSSSVFVDRVRVPLLCINSLDDPIVSIDAVPVEAALENPYLVVAVSRHGGHLGWFEGLRNPRRMIHRPILEWLFALNQVTIATDQSHVEIQNLIENPTNLIQVKQNLDNLNGDDDDDQALEPVEVIPVEVDGAREFDHPKLNKIHQIPGTIAGL